MQPKALSLEPLIILSLGVLLFVVTPFLVWVVWKRRAIFRVSVVVLAVVTCSFYFLSLGEAMGRSKAWYHWRREYKDPLEDLQNYLAEAQASGNTRAIDAFCREFARQKVPSYGREQLFRSSAFRQFVESIKPPGSYRTNAPVIDLP